MIRFGKRGKLSPMYFGLFKILFTVEEVTYESALCPDFADIHPIFYVFMLRHYISNESHVLRWDSKQINERLIFVEEHLLYCPSMSNGFTLERF